MAKKSVVISDSPLEDWFTKAQALGWSAKELSGLQSLMDSRHATTCVVEVARWVIQVVSSTVFEISGIGRDGQTFVRQLPQQRRWAYRRHSVLTIHKDYAEDPLTDWCPAHGNACARAVYGCIPAQAHSVIELELADAWIEERRKTVPSHARLQLSNRRHAQRPAKRKKNGKSSVLRGQLSLKF